MLYLTFARLASVIPAGRRQVFKASEHLAWGDLSFCQRGVVVRLTKTKTVQMSERFLTFLIPVHDVPSTCLTSQLQAWRRISPLTAPEDPVFVVPGVGGRPVPLTRRRADPAFKGALARAGARPGSYGFSSFRRGGATSYFLATGGKDVESLMSQGDWRSGAYREYLYLPGTSRGHVAGTLQRELV